MHVKVFSIVISIFQAAVKIIFATASDEIDNPAAVQVSYNHMISKIKISVDNTPNDHFVIVFWKIILKIQNLWKS